MNYFKNTNNEIFAYDDEQVKQGYGKDLTPITEEEKDELLAPTEEEQKQIIYNQWKAERQLKVDNIEVELNGVIYQGDETSQTRIARAVSVMEDTDITMWVAKDNSVNELSKADLKYILREAGIKQTLVWNEGRPEGGTKICGK